LLLAYVADRYQADEEIIVEHRHAPRRLRRSGATTLPIGGCVQWRFVSCSGSFAMLAAMRLVFVVDEGLGHGPVGKHKRRR
jgi:uncharacterized glyoxalase superfamily protein PhnB